MMSNRQSACTGAHHRVVHRVRRSQSPRATNRLVYERLEDRRLMAFGDDGTVVTDWHGWYEAAALQTDEKIVAVGNVGLARYNSDGTLDGSFNASGDLPGTIPAAGYLNTVAIGANGRIVAAGRTYTADDSLLLRAYTADGAPDSSFGSEGLVTTNLRKTNLNEEILGLAIQPWNQKVVAVGLENGGNWAVLRYNVNGSLDTTFDRDGKLTGFSKANSFSEAQAVAVQADRKIVVAGRAVGANGWQDFALARYFENGQLDASFGISGKVLTDFGPEIGRATSSDGIRDIVIQPDGKIIVCGHAGGVENFAIARYNANGSLDTTFSGDGKLVLHHPNPDGGTRRLEGIAVQSDGKIVVVGGIWTVYVARLNADGSADATFDGDGWQELQFDPSNPESRANDVLMQSDGKIAVVGGSGSPHRFAAARLNPDGSLDAEPPREVLATAAEPQSASLFAVQSSTVSAAGDLDPTFGGDGFVTTPIGPSANANVVAVQPDGLIVAAGRMLNSRRGWDIALARYRADGTLDPTFGNSGTVITPVSKNTGEANALLLQNGKVIAGGWADLNNGPFVSDFDRAFTLVRYNANGTLDTSFGGKGKGGKVYTQLNPASRDERLNDLAFQGTKIIAAGISSGNIALARYDSEGRLDTTFGNNGTKIIDLGGGEEALGVVVQPDGKIVVAGSGSISGIQDVVLIRLNSDGRSLDASFGSGGVVMSDVVINGASQNNYAKDIALQADGKLVVTGLGQVARYKSDGSLDSTFGQDLDGNGVRDGFSTAGSGEELVIDSQQRIVVGSTWASPDSESPAEPWDTDFAILRFTPSGDFDPMFGTAGVVAIDPSGTNSESLAAIALQPDGKIVAAGLADYSTGQFALVRLAGDSPVAAIASQTTSIDGGAGLFTAATEQVFAEQDISWLHKRKRVAFV